MGAIKEIVAGVLSLVFPDTCVLCGDRLATPGFCRGCSREVGRIEEPACTRCGCPGVEDPENCPNCVEKAFQFDRLCVAWTFSEEIQELVHGLKYDGKTWVAPAIVNAVATRFLEADPPQMDTVVVPVPLHSARMRERGYNQSEILAKGIGRTLGYPVRNVLKRVRPTETQTRLDLEQRALNVEDAFELRGTVDLQGRRVLLCDDVVTTGATVNACAEALSASGADDVIVLAAASPYHLD